MTAEEEWKKMKASELSKEELREEYVGVCETIDKIGCYGTKDVMWRITLEREIAKRGGEVNPEVSVQFPTEEGNEEWCEMCAMDCEYDDHGNCVVCGKYLL